jgi:MFS family permease
MTATSEVTGQGRTLAVATAGTVLALIAYTTPVGTLAATASALDAGPGGQAWILSSMSCGLAVALLPSGAVGDDYGRRRMFMIGALLLAASSVLATFAPDTLTLVLARVGQGLGSAAVIACGLGLIGHSFPGGHARVRATGMWGAGVGAGIAVGPLLAAGLESGLGAGWRAPYAVTAVLALVLAGAGRGWLAESTSDRHQAVDGWGIVLFALALAGVLAGLVEGREGWLQPSVLALLGGGVVGAVAFVVVELRSRGPMLDLRLLRRPDFAGATVGAVATGAGVIATMSFLPTLVQRALGHSATYAAFLLLGWSATSVVTALLARRLPFSPRAQLVAGLLGVAVGQAMLVGIDTQAGVARLLPGLLVAGAASGVLNAALGRQAVASAPPGLASVGSGANNTARYLGAAVGVTVVAVLAAHPDPAAMVAGWNVAVVVDAAVSVVGALLVLACRSTAAL